jgi:5-(carboxyamino)imidazole ribonucleotide mutase
MPEVGIIMGSDSDLPVVKDAAIILEKLGIEYEMLILSAHRTPDRMTEYAKTAKIRGIKVIIAGAGGAAHLAGMTAANCRLPVIGIPVHTKNLNGLDSLYSIVQMPPGIPVATVAINGAQNAGLLAAQIIALNNDEIYSKLEEYAKELQDMVTEKSIKLEKEGFKNYK